MPSDIFNPRSATKAGIPAMTETLVRSFTREPFHQWMVPDPTRWAEKAPRYFRAYIKMILRDGCADTAQDGAVAALWLAPNKPGGMLSRIQLPFVLWRLAGVRFKAVWETIPQLERNRPQDPHWYLDVLGVEPRHARQGLGSALLQYGLSRSDAAGQPVVLDAMSVENVGFYERHGFAVTTQTKLDSGLSIWTMARQPKALT